MFEFSPQDSQVPAWLQRNWGPTQSSQVDPTPWLQERYRRQVQAQTLPLQLQGMALQNQAQQLAIDHQGMVNDLQAQELQAYQRDLPKLQDFYNRTKGDPVRVFQEPVPQLESLQGQKVLQGNFAAAAQNEYAKNYLSNETAKFALAAKALSVGQNIPMIKDPVTGQPSFDSQSIADAYNQGALRDLVGKAFLQQSKGNSTTERVNLLESAKNDLARAQQSGDPSAIASAQQRLQSVTEVLPGQQMTVFDPKTGQPIVQMGRGGSNNGMSPGAQSEQEKKILNDERGIGDLSRMRENLTDEVVGPRAAVGSYLFDRVMGVVDPSWVNNQRVAGRSQMQLSTQDMLSEMRQHYSESAVRRIENMLPSSGFFENPTRAREATDQIIRSIAEDTAARSVAIGRPPSEVTLRALSRLSNEQIQQDIKSGYLSADVAKAALSIRGMKPGTVPPGFEPRASAKPMVMSNGTVPTLYPQRITIEDLIRLYRSGALAPGGINMSTPSDTSEGEEE